jgi:hypothetical protein
MTDTTAPRSFKVGVKTPGDKSWVYNGLRFATREEADRYGSDLYARWTAVQEVDVHPSADPVNYAIRDGRLVRLADDVRADAPDTEAAG